MEIVFMEFCRKYKKYTKLELGLDELKSLYEPFICNYESIRLYMLHFWIKKGYIWWIAHFWDDDFIVNYFTHDAFLARELGISIKEVQENFSMSVKFHFLINNISDPIKACKRWKNGEIIIWRLYKYP